MTAPLRRRRMNRAREIELVRAIAAIPDGDERYPWCLGPGRQVSAGAIERLAEAGMIGWTWVYTGRPGYPPICLAVTVSFPFGVALQIAESEALSEIGRTGEPKERTGWQAHQAAHWDRGVAILGAEEGEVLQALLEGARVLGHVDGALRPMRWPYRRWWLGRFIEPMRYEEWKELVDRGLGYVSDTPSARLTDKGWALAERADRKAEARVDE